jgi:glycosyltransferase involved in cell wall biosynthesis
MKEISVIICSFNHQKWIERCLRSLINQKIIKQDEYEILIVNDKSQDNTKKILKKYNYISNLKIINNSKNIGLPSSINNAIHQSSGRYIVRVDSDDYVDRYFLFFLHYFLSNNRNYGAASCDYIIVDDKEEYLRTENSQKNEIACGIMFRREALIDIGLYNKNFSMREGHELKKRFEKKYEIGRIPFPLYKYRKHSLNRTKNIKLLKKFDKKLRKLK